MKLKILSIVLAAAFLPVFFSACSSRQEPADVLLTKSFNCAVNGDWKLAADFAKRAAEQEPSNVNALILYSLALSYTDQLQSAIDESLKAVKIAPGSFMAQYLKGYLLYRNRNYDQCIEPLRIARSLRPSDMNSAILLAQASLKLRNATAAAGYYKIIAKDRRFNSTPAPWVGLGMAFLETRPTLARSYFMLAEKRAPENPLVALNLAVVNDSNLRSPLNAVPYYNKFMRLTQDKSGFDAMRAKVQKRLTGIAAQ